MLNTINFVKLLKTLEEGYAKLVAVRLHKITYLIFLLYCNFCIHFLFMFALLAIPSHYRYYRLQWQQFIEPQSDQVHLKIVYKINV